MDNDYDTANLQTAGIELADAIEELDADLLDRMTPDQRAAQIAAREAVADHFDVLWDSLKLRGLAPADNDDQPPFAAAAGLRDLTEALRVAAESAAAEADDDEDLDPATAPVRETGRRDQVTQWLATADLAELRAARETCNPADVLDLAQALAERDRA